MLFNWLFGCLCSLQVNFRIQLGRNFLPCRVRVLDRVNSNICFVNYMNNTHIYIYIRIYIYIVDIDSDKYITCNIFRYSSILYPTLWRYRYQYHPVVFFCWTLSLKHFPSTPVFFYPNKNPTTETPGCWEPEEILGFTGAVGACRRGLGDVSFANAYRCVFFWGEG